MQALTPLKFRGLLDLSITELVLASPEVLLNNTSSSVTA